MIARMTDYSLRLCICDLYRWDRDSPTIRHAKCVGIITAVHPLAHTRPVGAAIGRRGLGDTNDNPRDHLEEFAWQHAASLLGGQEHLSSEYSQCYGLRFSNKTVYMDGRIEYSPPTTGLIPGTMAHVFKVQVEAYNLHLMMCPAEQYIRLVHPNVYCGPRLRHGEVCAEMPFALSC
jgi:hypothetical protein